MRQPTPSSLSPQVSRAAGAAWRTGRASMLYRDLIADRHGGRFIASHIHLGEAGPVADYVHFHRVRLQLIVCISGSIAVVYQDQGAPFVLEPGDAVLQPPGIRHRVLECAAGSEVVELTCPAAHETRADPHTTLPGARRPGRLYGGQRFTRHVAARARWRPWRAGFEARDLGISEATSGLASAAIARRTGDFEPLELTCDGELLFQMVLGGEAVLEVSDRDIGLEAKDAVSIPAGTGARLREASADLELLEVSVARR